MSEQTVNALPGHIYPLTGVAVVRVGVRKVWLQNWERQQIGTMTRAEYDALGACPMQAAFAYAEKQASAPTSEQERNERGQSR